MHDIRVVLYMISQSSDMIDTANRIVKSCLVKRKQSTHNIVSSYLSRVEVQQKSVQSEYKMKYVCVYESSVDTLPREGDESERRELC
jgi:hypothetical protein